MTNSSVHELIIISLFKLLLDAIRRQWAHNPLFKTQLWRVWDLGGFGNQDNWSVSISSSYAHRYAERFHLIWCLEWAGASHPSHWWAWYSVSEWDWVDEECWCWCVFFPCQLAHWWWGPSTSESFNPLLLQHFLTSPQHLLWGDLTDLNNQLADVWSSIVRDVGEWCNIQADPLPLTINWELTHESLVVRLMQMGLDRYLRWYGWRILKMYLCSLLIFSW